MFSRKKQHTEQDIAQLTERLVEKLGSDKEFSIISSPPPLSFLRFWFIYNSALPLGVKKSNVTRSIDKAVSLLKGKQLEYVHNSCASPPYREVLCIHYKIEDKRYGAIAIPGLKINENVTSEKYETVAEGEGVENLSA